MREQLIGFLLGSLDPREEAAVEARLETDPELRKELEIMRRALAPLAEPRRQDTRWLADDHARVEPELAFHAADEQAPRGAVDSPDELNNRWESPPQDLADKAIGWVMTQRREACLRHACELGRGWRLVDLIVAVGVFGVAAMLLFPALSNGRFQSRLAGCQNNLRRIGQAIFTYSDHHGGYLPPVATDGPLSVGGAYSAILKHGGYLEDDGTLICPDSPLSWENDVAFGVPTLRELELATPDELGQVQCRMGGSYAYSFGYVHEGRYRWQKHTGRERFVILADAPSRFCQGTIHHGQRGLNVIFDDGHFEFIPVVKLSLLPDDFRLNSVGLVAPGVHANDAVVASSAESLLLTPVALRD